MKKLTFILLALIGGIIIIIFYGNVIAPFLGIEYTEEGRKQVIGGVLFICIGLFGFLYTYLKKKGKIK